MDLSPEQFTQLYSVPPQEFLTVRDALAEAAKSDGDADLARRIAAQRKPTLAAWIVNRQVHDEPARVDQLLDLGSRLRDAHADLDPTALRDLSSERRQLVTELTTVALARAERSAASTALRDDVTATFDAAVADPAIAARLGRLTRPERWSGFGIAADAPPGPPELTVIRGGRGHPAIPRSSSTHVTEPRGDTRADPGARRRARRARDKAADALTAADADLQAVQDAQHAATERLRELTAELSRVQDALTSTTQELERTRREVKSARNRRREARSALDRAERQVDHDQK